MVTPPNEDKPYSDRFYSAQAISNLPHYLQFDDVTFTIDYARHSEVTSLLPAVILSAVGRADNVGTDEFDGHITEFLFEHAFVFTARLQPSGLVGAFIVISPSQFSRTIDPCLADIHVFRTDDVTEEAYVGLVGLSLEFTGNLDVGYTDCLVSVTATSFNLVDALINRLQFSVISTIPESVQIKGVEDKLVDDIVLLRSITPQDTIRQPRSVEQVLSMLAEHGFADGPVDDARYETATLPQVAFLPQNYVLPAHDDLIITIRNMHKNEDRLVFDMLTRTADNGEGIALHDSPNLAFLRTVALLEVPCVVFEDSLHGSLLGFLIVRPSPSVRSPQAKCAATTLVIDKPYQNRGLGRELSKLMHALVRQMGYTALVNDHFTNNVRAHRIASSIHSATVLGVIPRAAYLVGKGWHGIEIVHVDLSNEPSFNQLIEENQRDFTAQLGNRKLPAKL